MDQPTPTKSGIIKNIYLYLVSFVALLMVAFSVANLIDIVLRTYIFTKADQAYFYEPAMVCPTAKTTDGASSTAECYKNEEQNRKSQKENQAAQRQRDLVRDISMIVVGIPLFIYHWRLARKKELSQ